MVMSAVIALAYYCYRKKSKGRQVTGEPGIFGRIGFRSRQNHIHQVNRGKQAAVVLKYQRMCNLTEFYINFVCVCSEFSPANEI